jgi:pantothenate kinase type III
MLTVDLGNSRLKAQRWERSSAGFEPGARYVGDPLDLAPFARWLGRGVALPCALSSVAGRERTEPVRAALEASGVALRIAPETGLTNRCREPEQVGLDRLYAAAGARALFGRSCVVVDAGTALTVDALEVVGRAAAFLGGAIAPGPELNAAALASGTARLPLVEPRVGARALGRSTEEAILAGVVLGFRGAAGRLVEELVRETGFPDPLVVLTGGARAFLLEPQPFTERALEVVPELVHRGLLAALLHDSVGARGE